MTFLSQSSASQFPLNVLKTYCMCGVMQIEIGWPAVMNKYSSCIHQKSVLFNCPEASLPVCIQICCLFIAYGMKPVKDAVGAHSGLIRTLNRRTDEVFPDFWDGTAAWSGKLHYDFHDRTFGYPSPDPLLNKVSQSLYGSDARGPCVNDDSPDAITVLLGGLNLPGHDCLKKFLHLRTDNWISNMLPVNHYGSGFIYMTGSHCCHIS